MANEKKYEIALPEGTNELVIREGIALPPVKLDKVIIIGTIGSAREYIMKHYATILATVEGEQAILQPGVITYCLDMSEGKGVQIVFDEFPSHPFDGAKVTGKLLINPELKNWKLNEDDFMTVETAVKFIRKNAHHFPTKQAAADLINNFKNFEVKFEDQVKKADDQRGNTENNVKQAINFVSGEIPKTLDISLPLFKAGPKETLTLEIVIERRGNQPALAFYCLELETVIREKAAKIVGDQLDGLEKNFVLIEVQ